MESKHAALSVVAIYANINAATGSEQGLMGWELFRK